MPITSSSAATSKNASSNETSEDENEDEDTEDSEQEEEPDCEDAEEDDETVGAGKAKVLVNYIRKELSFIDEISEAFNEFSNTNPAAIRVKSAYELARERTVFVLEKIKSGIRIFGEFFKIKYVFSIIGALLSKYVFLRWPVRFCGTIVVAIFLVFFLVVYPVIRIVKNPTRVFKWLADLVDFELPEGASDTDD